RRPGRSLRSTDGLEDARPRDDDRPSRRLLADTSPPRTPHEPRSGGRRCLGGPGAHLNGRFAVAIPAFEAAETVAQVIRRVRTVTRDLVVVDDGSTDGTLDAARICCAEVLIHDLNLGKGRALRTAFDALFARGFDAVVTIDADGQHPPEEIP